MIKKTVEFIKKNFFRFFIDFSIIFFIFIVPKINFRFLIYFINAFKNIVSFQSRNYLYSNPPIFFSIGEVVAAVAILLAVYQFRKEKWEIALEVRKNIRIVIPVLVLFSFFAIIISAVVSFIEPTNIFLLSVFWQITSSIFITIAIVLLFIKTTNRHLFNEKTKNQFVSALIRRVLSRSPKQIDLVVDSLVVNMKTILKEISSSPRREKISEFTKKANFIITQIMSDPALAHHIVTIRADFFQLFLRSIQENNLYNDQSISVAFNSFMKAAFLNRNSYFYFELRHSDPGIYYKPFLEDIFFDQTIFLSLRPFGQINFDYGENIESEKLSLFITSLETALEGYFSEKRTEDFEYSHYNQAFEHVENVLSRVIDEIKNTELKNNWQIINKLHQITFFAGWKFQYLYSGAFKKNRISNHDLNAPVDERSYGIYPKSLTAGYAKLIFKLLCILCELSDKKDIRHYAMSMTDKILNLNDQEFSKIREVLLRYLWEKIRGEHMSNIAGYYPVVLPVFLSLVGMWQDSATPQRKALYNQTVEFLNNELRPKILARTKMVNGDLMEKRLLPPEVIFNRRKNIFEWKMVKGVQEMKIRK